MSRHPLKADMLSVGINVREVPAARFGSRSIEQEKRRDRLMIIIRIA